jgi:hypothetical protein
MSTPSFKLSFTITGTVPPSRRNARSWSSAQTCALDCRTSKRIDFREWPSVSKPGDVDEHAPALCDIHVEGDVAGVRRGSPTMAQDSELDQW